MKRTGWTWAELQDTPAPVVDAVAADLVAESNAEQIRVRWQTRQS